jgi:molecular chaperone DnaJ
MAGKDFYNTLGISRQANEKDIKSAYRKLAMKFHPDRNPGDKSAEKKFKEVNEAYEILKDPSKRSQFDNFGSAAFEQGGGGRGAGGFGGGASGFGDFSDMNFGDIFSDFFGDSAGESRGQTRRKTAGADLRYNMSLKLEDVYDSVEKEISFSAKVNCGSCNGAGGEKGAKPSSCGTCSGRGKVRSQQGFFIVEKTCHNCGGTGEIIANPCRKCRGEGRVDEKRKLNVKIPAGVETGTKIRLESEGEAGLRGAANGDLYIFVVVQDHEFFIRDSSDLLCKVPVLFTTAAIGGKVEIPTIAGKKVELKIPSGTQAADKFRLSGNGMPILNSGRKGDMYVEVAIEVPVNLNAKQKDLMQQLEEEIKNSPDAMPETNDFFKRFKSFFK